MLRSELPQAPKNELHRRRFNPCNRFRHRRLRAAPLKVDDSSAASLPMVSTVSISVGEPVYAIGNPRGLQGTFSQGVVSSLRTFASDRLLQMRAPISPGTSGGPVLDHNGAVVGV